MVIDLLIKATNFVILIFQSVKDKEEKDKEKISFLLEKISETLENVAMSLEKNEYPHQKCEEMRFYSQELISSVDGILKKEVLDELNQSLMNATELERLYAERNQDSINQISVCAGKFKAMSVLIKT